MSIAQLLNSLRKAHWIVVLALVVLPLTVGAADMKTYTLAVIPNLPAVTLHKNWTPFVEQLSKDIGARIELKLYDKIGTFLGESEDGIPDFIYSAPNMFFLAYQKQKYVPLVRSSLMLTGQVFVRKDSPYKNLKDLQGKTIAFVGPKNVCSVITRHAMMTGAGTIDYTTAFSGSTVNVAKSVLLGKADAGASLDISIMNDVPEMKGEFRTLLETEKIASHPLAAHPRVPKAVREAMTRAILAMDKTDPGKKLLAAVKLKNPIGADYKRDYSLFADVDFDRLDKQGK
jgi:phosphonate transport system substrate-binding protein